MDIFPILSSLRRHRVTAVLVILEIALTCAIVCNAVFLIHQRIERMQMPSGIAEHELSEVSFADIGDQPDARARTQADLALLRQIPGVRSVSLSNQLPFGNMSFNSGIKLDPKQQKNTLGATNYFGEQLSETLGLRLLEGRNLRSDDFVDISVASASAGKVFPHVVVITRGLADTLWPKQPALGKLLYRGDAPLQVVGVVANLVRPSLDDDPGGENTMIVPIRNESGKGDSFLLRSAPQDRDRVLAAAVAALQRANPNRVLLEHRRWDAVRAKFFEGDRAMAGLLSGICVALLVVTALGIVGLASFWVAQRRRQIGVRRALGATRGDILRYFQTENFLLATIGIALGMVLAYGLNLWLMVQYELPRLPTFYLPIGALALWSIGQLAVLGPALRAAAVAPVVATRSV